MNKLMLAILVSSTLLSLTGIGVHATDLHPINSTKAYALKEVRAELERWKASAQEDLKNKESLASYLLPIFETTAEKLRVAINAGDALKVAETLSNLEKSQATFPLSGGHAAFRLRKFSPNALLSANRELTKLESPVQAGDILLTKGDKLYDVMDTFQTRLLRAAKEGIGMTEFERAPQEHGPKREPALPIASKLEEPQPDIFTALGLPPVPNTQGN